jgi:hypothetical protein
MPHNCTSFLYVINIFHSENKYKCVLQNASAPTYMETKKVHMYERQHRTNDWLCEKPQHCLLWQDSIQDWFSSQTLLYNPIFPNATYRRLNKKKNIITDKENIIQMTVKCIWTKTFICKSALEKSLKTQAQHVWLQNETFSMNISVLG